MTTPMDNFPLWSRTLGDQPDTLNARRDILRQGFLQFRERTAQLVGEIGGLLPGLTVHDVTHLDSLWRLAHEIAGPNFPLNPAEAFVLGGAILMHDAAHVLAAYPKGLDEIKQSLEWKDLIAQRFKNTEPAPGSSQERSALFQVLRHLHAKQARQLPKMSWKVPSTGDEAYLLESLELRNYYGDVIGEIAESHHWPTHRVATMFHERHINAPGFLAPASWSVDMLKVAFLLRTADAAHIDSQRAPWFLFALRCPDGISQSHWAFQAKMGQPTRTARGELRLASGSSFDVTERQAWWLAYDVACMIDRELRDAQKLMQDAGREVFATVSVEHISTPEVFATNVPTKGWEPVNVQPKIGDVTKVIANLGGIKLYGNRPELALRELIQNAADAIRALRALGGLGIKEGEIQIALEYDGTYIWLHVTDTGIGMSRYVLTEVLLDFGNSLWTSEALRSELPGLAAKGFQAVGRFGIGFFSTFMLGNKVLVTTRRYNRATSDLSDQWVLEFGEGLAIRPTLRKPTSDEALPRNGTRVSVAMNPAFLKDKEETFYNPYEERLYFKHALLYAFATVLKTPKEKVPENDPRYFNSLVLQLCPTLDISLRVNIQGQEFEILKPDDWKTLEQSELLARSGYKDFWTGKLEKVMDLRESSGVLVGRVAFKSRGHAVITCGGVRSGILRKLAGVLLGHNNSDLIRRESMPLASKDAWMKWAEEWIDSTTNNAEDLSELHPLCPHRDLRVYRLGGAELDRAQLIDWLGKQTEVRVLSGMPDHEDYDDVSRDSFQSDFRLGEDILCLPLTGMRLAQSLGIPDIDYEKTLEQALEQLWKEVEVYEDDDTVVGEVNGVEIIRTVNVYTRSM